MQIELGKVVGVWGVKGWLKLHSYTRERFEIGRYSAWWLQPPKSKFSQYAESKNTHEVADLHRYSVVECREQGRGVVAKLDDVETRDAAERLIGCRIFVEQKDLPKLPEGEYYWQQLIGLTVSTSDGGSLGKVTSVLETGANDVLVVKSDSLYKDGFDVENVDSDKRLMQQDILIPYVDDVVLNIDLPNARLTVNWDPAFLLDD